MKNDFTFNLLFVRAVILSALIGVSLIIGGCQAIKAGEVIKAVSVAAATDIVVDEVQKHRSDTECDITRGDIPVFDAERNQMYCNKRMGDSY